MLVNLNRYMKKFRREESGFTIIELLVVLVILGIIGAIVIPKFFTSVDTAKEGADAANIQMLESAAERYRLEKGSYPSSNMSELVSDYVYKIPDKPTGGAYTLDSSTGKVQ